MGHTHRSAGARNSPADAREDDYLVDGSHLDGRGVHRERASMRPIALLPHGSVLPADGGRHATARLRSSVAGSQRLVVAGTHLGRCRGWSPVVLARAPVGKIFNP